MHLSKSNKDLTQIYSPKVPHGSSLNVQMSNLKNITIILKIYCFHDYFDSKLQKGMEPKNLAMRSEKIIYRPNQMSLIKFSQKYNVINLFINV